MGYKSEFGFSVLNTSPLPADSVLVPSFCDASGWLWRVHGSIFAVNLGRVPRWLLQLFSSEMEMLVHLGGA